ncbi:MAG: hypothetical protein WD048_11120 [Chitinophagales bacterium]
MQAQTTYSDGPMRLVVRVAFVYIDDYYDVFGGDQEPRWKVWARDYPNLDGMDWQGYHCIQYNCACYQWVNAPNHFGNAYWVMNNYYTGSNVPGGIDLRLESFEKDGCSGPNCGYESSKFSNCYDGDDAHWGPGGIGSNIQYRNMGPPCQWNGSEIVNGTWQYTGAEYYGGSSPYYPYYQWGIQINTYWEYTGSTAGTYYWRGFYSDDWNHACNWSTNSVPTSTKNVVIPDPPTNPPTTYHNPVVRNTNSGVDAYCYTLTIQGSAEIEIQSTNNAELRVTQ